AAHGNLLVPASNTALVDLMTKNFEHMNKLEPIPIAVVHDGNSDVDLQTWPGSLITEKLKHVEIECGVEFRPVSMDSDYRVLLALGKTGPENLIVREDIVRQTYLKELRRLLGSDQKKISITIMEPDVWTPVYIIGGFGKVSALLPFPYLRISVGDWDT